MHETEDFGVSDVYRNTRFFRVEWDLVALVGSADVDDGDDGSAMAHEAALDGVLRAARARADAGGVLGASGPACAALVTLVAPDAPAAPAEDADKPSAGAPSLARQQHHSRSEFGEVRARNGIRV